MPVKYLSTPNKSATDRAYKTTKKADVQSTEQSRYYSAPVLTPRESVMPHSNSLSSNHAAYANALQSRDCSICLEPLSKGVGEDKRYPVIRAHQATASTGVTHATPNNLTTKPNNQTAPCNPNVADRLSGEHLFHTNCYAEHIARNGHRAGAYQQDWELRCPLCQKSVNFSQIEPFHTPDNAPNWLQANAFKREVRKSVESLITANNLETRQDTDRWDYTPLDRGLMASPRQAVLRTRHHYPIYSQSRLNVGRHYGSTARAPSSQRQPEPLPAGEQQALGTIITGIGFAVAALHGPVGLAVMLGTLGACVASTGAARDCINGQQRGTNGQTADSNPRPSERDALIVVASNGNDTSRTEDTTASRA